MQLFLVVQNTDEESDQDATFTNYKTEVTEIKVAFNFSHLRI